MLIVGVDCFQSQGESLSSECDGKIMSLKIVDDDWQ